MIASADPAQVVWLTLLAQFADMADAERATSGIVRLMLAALLGGVLGYEREQKGKSAGLRTHILVAVGSALLVLVAQQADMDGAGSSRVIQGIVAGIGFIGAGTIFTRTAESRPHGLTTAAGIWLTSAIGVAAGMGNGATAVFATVLALIVLALLPRMTSLQPRSADANSDPDQY